MPFYAPAVWQGSQVHHIVHQATYLTVEDKCQCNVDLEMTGSGVTGDPIVVSLPFAVGRSPDLPDRCPVIVVDVSADRYYPLTGVFAPGGILIEWDGCLSSGDRVMVTALFVMSEAAAAKLN